MTGEEAFDAWAPAGAPWSAWVKPVLFACMTSDSLRAHRPLRGESVDWAPAADSRTAIVVDLPGVRGLSLGFALQQSGYQAVPLYNAAPSDTGYVIRLEASSALIDMFEVALALQDTAALLDQWPVRADAPPAFLLDWRRRGERTDLIPGRFDNRSVSFTTDFPSAHTLRAAGIRRALLVQTERDAPQPDLAHTLRAWQDAGIDLALKRLDVPHGETPLRVGAPSRFGGLWFRAAQLLRLRRHPLGGFGGVIPEPSQGGGFAG